MASSFGLDGNLVPRSASRQVDQRVEERHDATGEDAVLHHRGRKYEVRMINVSRSGAMLIFSLIPHIGEPIKLELSGRGTIDGRVLWVRDGRIGIGFAAGLE